MSQNLELPDSVYQALQEAAKASGTTPVDWIVSHLTNSGNRKCSDGIPAKEEIEAANARLKQHMVSLGFPTGCDNEQIDADLAREAGAIHRNS